MLLLEGDQIPTRILRFHVPSISVLDGWPSSVAMIKGEDLQKAGQNWRNMAAYGCQHDICFWSKRALVIRWWMYNDACGVWSSQHRNINRLWDGLLYPRNPPKADFSQLPGWKLHIERGLSLSLSHQSIAWFRFPSSCLLVSLGGVVDSPWQYVIYGSWLSNVLALRDIQVSATFVGRSYHKPPSPK